MSVEKLRGRTPPPEVKDAMTASEFNLWCAMNGKPYRMARHVWPDGAWEWDVEYRPGRPEGTIAYGTGQEDETLATLAAFAFVAGVEWQESLMRPQDVDDEDDEDLPAADEQAPRPAHHAIQVADADYAARAGEFEVVDEALVVAGQGVATDDASPDDEDDASLDDEDDLEEDGDEADLEEEDDEEDLDDEDFDEDDLDEDDLDGEADGAAEEQELDEGDLEFVDPDEDSAPVAAEPVAAPPAAGFDAAEESAAPSYLPPSVTLLQEPPQSEEEEADELALASNARTLETVLRNFKVRGEIMQVKAGPVVTLYEFEPVPGTKSSTVINLSDDIARSMSAVTARIAVVPGRSVIGIELPNPERETVYLRDMMESPAYAETAARLPLVLGKDIGGEPVVADLAKMPHLLIAGTTGSGKSVGINTMILSLLYRLPPERCRLIMVDPKMLELSVYDGIPHLLTPVVTDPKKAVVAMKWAVKEMESRYRSMAALGVRNIEGYNERVGELLARGEQVTRSVQVGFDRETGEPIMEEQYVDLAKLPYIVVVVDEMADLMLVAGKEIEAAIQRLAQMARAAGIHLIMATQRPSVDVITGTIKANFPTRISFQVTSKIDSRTILGEQGAEQLLGQGDMLYMASGGRITRVHGPFVSDGEVEQVVSHLKRLGSPEYLHTITEEEGDDDGGDDYGSGGGAVFDGTSVGEEGSSDPYDQALALVLREGKVSVSFIQRHLQIGYNRAARIVERMEQEGIISAANHVGKRDILVSASRYLVRE
ncbi:DNA translocase FtsK [Insolitispirillum peregrinum]|uniref:DNA segregation ATPase FtsK/SpoIIIE, S-DNA-T family n=1 Tax=Insolitispirillum peregrinum TaxID=80876 RepID=A0A1N7IKD0_9PROT|nr:DNA translocase FtsK [Insolitispirillum peregrinum]SIS37564.1 DNA segregation ATPase FtsK/SpoIIIE, S-DNA-T family [Insolitispirillum peregrinum]